MPDAGTSTCASADELLTQKNNRGSRKFDRVAAACAIQGWYRNLQSVRECTRLMALLYILNRERDIPVSGDAAHNEESHVNGQDEINLASETMISIALDGAHEYASRLVVENASRRKLVEQMATTSETWRRASHVARAVLTRNHPSLRQVRLLSSEDVRKLFEVIWSWCLEECGQDDSEADVEELLEQLALLCGKKRSEWLLLEYVPEKCRVWRRDQKGGVELPPFQRAFAFLSGKAREGFTACAQKQCKKIVTFQDPAFFLDGGDKKSNRRLSLVDDIPPLPSRPTTTTTTAPSHPSKSFIKEHGTTTACSSVGTVEAMDEVVKKLSGENVGVASGAASSEQRATAPPQRLGSVYEDIRDDVALDEKQGKVALTRRQDGEDKVKANERKDTDEFDALAALDDDDDEDYSDAAYFAKKEARSKALLSRLKKVIGLAEDTHEDPSADAGAGSAASTNGRVAADHDVDVDAHITAFGRMDKVQVPILGKGCNVEEGGVTQRSTGGSTSVCAVCELTGVLTNLHAVYNGVDDDDDNTLLLCASCKMPVHPSCGYIIERADADCASRVVYCSTFCRDKASSSPR